MVVAKIPTKFRLSGHDPYQVKTTAGLVEYAAVVLESDDGSRQMIGLQCYLPFLGDGTLVVKYATCSRDPLAQWHDGVVPRSTEVWSVTVDG